MQKDYFNGIKTKEGLRHQRDGSIKNVEKAFTRLFDAAMKNHRKPFSKRDLKYCKDAIMEAFGINMTVESLEGKGSAAVSIPMFTSQHVLDKEHPDESGPWKLSEGENGKLSDEEKEIHNFFLNKHFAVEPGYVDRENLKVSGAFSKAPAKLFMPPEWIRWYLKSGRELTAVALHEIGHVFSTYTMMDHIVAGNALINDALRQKDENFKPIAITNQDFESLRHIRNKGEYLKNVRTIVHLLVVRATPQSIHHTSVHENLADNFVGRFEYISDAMDILTRTHDQMIDLDNGVDYQIWDAVEAMANGGNVEKQVIDYTSIAVASTARQYNLFTYRPIRDRILLNLNAASARLRVLKKHLNPSETKRLIASYDKCYKIFRSLRTLPDELEGISSLLRSAYVTSRNIEEIEVLSEYLVDNPLVIAAAKLNLK